MFVFPCLGGGGRISHEIAIRSSVPKKKEVFECLCPCSIRTTFSKIMVSLAVEWRQQQQQQWRRKKGKSSQQNKQNSLKFKFFHSFSFALPSSRNLTLEKLENLPSFSTSSFCFLFSWLVGKQKKNWVLKKSFCFLHRDNSKRQVHFILFVSGPFTNSLHFAWSSFSGTNPKKNGNKIKWTDSCSPLSTRNICLFFVKKWKRIDRKIRELEVEQKLTKVISFFSSLFMGNSKGRILKIQIG